MRGLVYYCMPGPGIYHSMEASPPPTTPNQPSPEVQQADVSTIPDSPAQAGLAREERTTQQTPPDTISAPSETNQEQPTLAELTPQEIQKMDIHNLYAAAEALGIEPTETDWSQEQVEPFTDPTNEPESMQRLLLAAKARIRSLAADLQSAPPDEASQIWAAMDGVYTQALSIASQMQEMGLPQDLIPDSDTESTPKEPGSNPAQRVEAAMSEGSEDGEPQRTHSSPAAERLTALDEEREAAPSGSHAAARLTRMEGGEAGTATAPTPATRRLEQAEAKSKAPLTPAEENATNSAPKELPKDHWARKLNLPYQELYDKHIGMAKTSLEELNQKVEALQRQEGLDEEYRKEQLKKLEGAIQERGLIIKTLKEKKQSAKAMPDKVRRKIPEMPDYSNTSNE